MKLAAAALLLVSGFAYADTIPFTLTGYEFWSDEARANHLAMESFHTQCKDLKDRASTQAGARLDSVSCGNPIPIVDNDPSQDLIAYSSIATVNLNGAPTQIIQAGTIAGQEVRWNENSEIEAADARKQARASYEAQCTQWISDMKTRFGASLLIADCGERDNSPAVDVPADTLAWRYVSHGRAVVAPSEDLAANAVKNSQPDSGKSIVVKKSVEELTALRDELKARLKELRDQLDAKSPSPSPLPQPQASDSPSGASQ